MASFDFAYSEMKSSSSPSWLSVVTMISMMHDGPISQILRETMGAFRLEKESSASPSDSIPFLSSLVAPTALTENSIAAGHEWGTCDSRTQVGSLSTDDERERRG